MKDQQIFRHRADQYGKNEIVSDIFSTMLYMSHDQLRKLRSEARKINPAAVSVAKKRTRLA